MSSIVKNDRQRQAVLVVSALLSPLMQLPGFAGKGKFFPEVRRSFNREMRLAMALNTGNQQLYRQLLESQGWNESQFTAVLTDLYVEEWLMVQSVWDFFNDLRPEIAVLHLQLYGVLPQWLELRPVVVSAITHNGIPVQLRLRGGFYASCFSNAWQSDDIAQTYFSGQTAAQDAGLLFSLFSLYAGMRDTLQELQAWRCKLAHPDVKPAADEQDRQFDEACQIAITSVREASAASALAYKNLLAAVTAHGFAKAVENVDARWLAQAMCGYIADSEAARRQVCDRSALMQSCLLAHGGDLVQPRAAEMVKVVLWQAVFAQSQAAGGLEPASIHAADTAVQALPDSVNESALYQTPERYRTFVPETRIQDLLAQVIAPVLGQCLRQKLALAPDADWLTLNAKLLAAHIDNCTGLMLVVENYRAAAEVL